MAEAQALPIETESLDILEELEKRIDRAVAEIQKLRLEKDELKKLVKEMEQQQKELREKSFQSDNLSREVEESRQKIHETAAQIEQIILKLDKAF